MLYMEKHNSSKKVAYCFSPSVMVATCEIEFALLIFTLIRYKINKLTILVSLLFGFLALFQISEYNVCRGYINASLWSHIGYISITLLPTLGIHIINVIRKKKDNRLVYFGYITSLIFVGYFALTVGSITGHQCLGNYVIFQVNKNLSWLYALYYYGWVITGTIVSFFYAEETRNKKIKYALYAFSAGYASFLIPTTTANLLDKATLNGIPSIMCGFAVLLAIIVTFLVLPKVAIKRLK